MSRRRGWTFFAIGLILALGTGIMAFFFLQQQAVTAAEQSRQAALEKYAPPPTLDLPVAARPLVPGTTISKSDYVIKPFPLDLVPIAAISDTVNLDNKVVVRPIGQGETFHTGQFLGGEGSSISQQIKKGYVLFAFPVEDLMSKSDVIKDGDHIDLNVSMPLKALKDDGTVDGEKDLGFATTLTLQNIEVFKVLRSAKSEDGQNENAVGAPVALLCSVTPADAVLLKYAKDADNAVIDFTLRSPVDTEPFTAPWMDRLEFSRRYLGPR